MAGQKDLDKLVIFHTVKIGVFLSATLNFLIVAFILFLIVKGINSFKKKKEEAPAATPEEIILLREIRDQLKK
jgi:large conductance mechanosensitive channel